MKAATLLFTYNRSHHTEEVLNALSKNDVLPEKLYVFQDGMKNGDDTEEWNKVNRLISSINWCDTEVIISDSNQGLAASIVTGITYVFRDYDAVIVLEDDCVPANSFIKFMNQCFEKYQNTKDIYSVSGYAYPVSLKEDLYDVYGCGRISSWGWGTWKDRWKIFEKDYELVKKMKQNEISSRNLAMWGAGLEDMLVGNIRGEINSWAVFWALNVIVAEGICINPYQSLIRNIGLDGSGTHCGSTNIWDVKIADGKKEAFNLPERIEIREETKREFIKLFGNYTAINRNDEAKEEIMVYGLGNFYLRNEEKVCEKYYVQAFVDRKKRGWFAGKQIIKRTEIKQYTYDWILIMIQDEEECSVIEKELIANGIKPEKILFGNRIYQ